MWVVIRELDTATLLFFSDSVNALVLRHPLVFRFRFQALCLPTTTKTSFGSAGYFGVWAIFSKRAVMFLY